MKQRVMTLWLMTGLLLFVGCGDGTDGTNAGKKGGMPTLDELATDQGVDTVVIEAEDFAKWGGKIEPPMRVCREDEYDEEASGGRYIVVDGDAGKPGAPIPGTDRTYPERWGALSYTFTVAKGGKYVFWGRKLYQDGCGNSFTLVLNGGHPVKFADQTTGRWHWHKPQTFFELKAGENTLEILNREDGVKLDQFILTKKLKFTPVGAE